MSLLRSNLLHMTGGFVLMGSWAAYANAAHPMPAPLVAGITQGTLTALITLGLKRTVETLCRALSGLARFVAPPLAACAISVGLLFTVHTAAGTPAVWATLAVPASVSTLYAALYAAQIGPDG